jgi:hypothetical protein
VFSSTYTNYRVLISNVTNTADNLLNLRFRENVTDKATNYKTSLLRVVANNTVAGTFVASATAIVWTVKDTGAVPTYGVLEISRPSATTGLCYASSFDLSNSELRTMFAVNSDMSNFTGFSIFPTAGNVSGTVSIYGYNV